MSENLESLGKLIEGAGGFCDCAHEISSSEEECESHEIHLGPELIRLLISKDENKKESARAVLYHELGHALSYEGIGEDSIFNNALSCLEESLSFDMYDQSPQNQKSLGQEVIADWISSQAFAQRIRSGRFTTSSTKEQALSMLQGKFCYTLGYTRWKKVSVLEEI